MMPPSGSGCINKDRLSNPQPKYLWKASGVRRSNSRIYPKIIQWRRMSSSGRTSEIEADSKMVPQKVIMVSVELPLPCSEQVEQVLAALRPYDHFGRSTRSKRSFRSGRHLVRSLLRADKIEEMRRPSCGSEMLRAFLRQWPRCN